MADKIVSWGGFDSKGTSGMGVTGSLNVTSTGVFGTEASGQSYIKIQPGTFDNNKIVFNDFDGGISTRGGELHMSTYYSRLTYGSYNWFYIGNSSYPYLFYIGDNRRILISDSSAKPTNTTAMLTVKGTGTTSSTIGFQVQNANTSASFTVLDNGLTQIPGGGKLDFSNASTQCFITTAGGGTGYGSRSLLLPGTGGQAHWAFYNAGGYGIQILTEVQDTLTITPGNSSSTTIMAINKSAASGYGGGGFIYYQTNSSNRIYTFGNPSSERGDETGVHTKIAAGAGGTVSTSYGNGGNVYLEGGAPAFSSNIPGNILISTGITGSKVGIATATPTSTLHVKGSTTVYASSSLKVENSSTSGSFKVTDTGKLFLAVSNSEGYTVPQAASSASMYIYEGPSNSGRAGITIHSGQSANNGSYLHLFNYISHWASGIQHYSSGGGAIQKMRFYIGYDASQQLGDGGNVMTISSNGLGINTLAAEITANLQVKGSGTTSSTKSLLVQDSAGSAILEAYDSGYVVVRQEKGINLASSINEWDNIKSIANSSLTLNPYWGVKVNGTYPSGVDTANIPLLHVTRTLAGPLSPLVKFEDSGSTRFIITNSGSVGIGTATPIYNLEVSSTSVYGTGFGIMSGANSGAEIGFQNRGYALPRWTIRATGAADGSSGDLTFQRLASTFPVSITANENLLVGTTTDSARLTVKGSGTTTSTKTLLLQNSNGTQLGYVDDSGRWQIGQGTNSGYALEVSGSARISSTSGGYKLTLKTTGEGSGAGLLVDQLGYYMLDVNASDVYMRPFPGSTSKLDFWSWNNYGGPTNVLFVQNGQYHVSLNSPDNYKVPIIKFPDSVSPIIMGNIATSAIRGYLTVGGAFYASASLGASQRIVSTVSAIANNDTLIGLDVQPTFANGAYTGVTNYALRVSGSTYLYKSGSTVLDVQGSSGQLFAVTDSLSGSLFSVNTVAGLPVIEAFSDNRVNIGKYGAYNIAVSSSTTTITGSLVVNGSDITSAWTSYTPSWTSDGTAPTLGNGSLTGAYKIIGKTCFVRVRLYWGSTTVNGTGVYYFSLPVSASVSWGVQMPASILDNGNAWYQATVNGEYGGYTNKVALIGQSSGANSSQGVAYNFPIAFGNLDSIQFAGSYEIA